MKWLVPFLKLTASLIGTIVASFNISGKYFCKIVYPAPSLHYGIPFSALMNLCLILKRKENLFCWKAIDSDKKIVHKCFLNLKERFDTGKCYIWEIGRYINSSLENLVTKEQQYCITMGKRIIKVEIFCQYYFYTTLLNIFLREINKRWIFSILSN